MIRIWLDLDTFERLIRGEDLVWAPGALGLPDEVGDVRVAFEEVSFPKMIETVKNVANEWFAADARRAARSRGEVVPVGELDVAGLPNVEMRKLLEIRDMLGRIETRLGIGNVPEGRLEVWNDCQQCGKVLTGLERRRRYCPACLANESGAPDI